MPPRRRQKSWRDVFFQMLFLLTIILLVYIYAQWSYPNAFRHLYPQEFQSHELKDIDQFPHYTWQVMQTYVFNSSLASQCEDIEVAKNDIAYCINQNNQIISIDFDQGKIKKLHQIKGFLDDGSRAYGLKLSRDQKLLYFAHAELGLCEFNIKKKTITKLVSSYQGRQLISLNSIQTHPTKPHILYFTQTSTQIPLKNFQIDIIMNLPFGRVFEFNKKTEKLSLLADSLYFANGIVFQQYDGQETVLIAESNRLRLTRVWVSGANRGHKQIAIDKLDIYLDNMKTNEKGEIWVAGPSMRNYMLYFADYHPIIRRILSRLHAYSIEKLVEDQLFGGAKIKFTNKNKKYEIEYVLWEKIKGWSFTTTINQKNNKLYLSSLKTKGIMVVNDFKKQLQKSRIKKQQELQQA